MKEAMSLNKSYAWGRTEISFSYYLHPSEKDAKLVLADINIMIYNHEGNQEIGWQIDCKEFMWKISPTIDNGISQQEAIACARNWLTQKAVEYA